MTLVEYNGYINNVVSRATRRLVLYILYMYVYDVVQNSYLNAIQRDMLKITLDKQKFLKCSNIPNSKQKNNREKNQ